jgi:hypothetical protein
MIIPYRALPILQEEARTMPTNTVAAQRVSSTFHYTFDTNGILNETGSMETSSSPYFWLNSGGQFAFKDGVGKTVEGSLGSFNTWRLLYANSNPLDTSGGYQPQNLLRLITRSKWRDAAQSIQFKIVKLNMIETPNRDRWSGVFLMSRYLNGDNLYYAGVRMDGMAVIKKKYQGTYYTLAIEKIFEADSDFDRNTNPNLIPGNRWMNIKSIVRNQTDGSVLIELWLDKEGSGQYQKAVSAVDKPGSNGSVLTASGYAGIRSDYMDLYLDDYWIEEL